MGRSYAGASLDNYKVVKTAGVVYTKSPLKSNPYGIIKTNTGIAGIVSSLYGVYVGKSNINTELIGIYFNLDSRLNNYLKPLVNKGPKNTLLISDQGALEGHLYLPKSLEEQNAIVDLFDKIQTLSRDIDLSLAALKKYKEVLQKTFYQAAPTTHAHLKDVVQFQFKSKVGAGQGISNGKYPLYLSGEKTSTLNSYMLDGCYIIANDGGEANFKLTSGKFSYSDHCICLKAASDDLTNYIFNYLESQKKKITYIGFVGSGLKNIDRDYFANMSIPLMNEETVHLSSQLFTIIDSLIRQCEKQINLLNTLKNVLLKEMFV